MSKHTPGPWKDNNADHDEPYQDIKIKAAGRTVCTVWIDDAPCHDFNAEQDANARLIAAAPDLLEVLRKVSMNAVYVDNGECSLSIDVVKKSTLSSPKLREKNA